MAQLPERIALPSIDDRPLRKRRRASQGLDYVLGDDTDEPLEGYTHDDVKGDWVDHDTASLATIDSERLYDSRPNRWRGSARQWNHLTEVDRGVVSALHRTRDGDLAAHLYDVFQLKKKTASDDDDTAWKPKSYWTAWPLRARFNPGVFTRSTPYRRRHHSQRTPLSARMHGQSTHSCLPPRAGDSLFSGPSGPLAEMVTAVILRAAREQFQQRQKASVEADGGSEALHAVVSADDGRSEQILQPTVRHLLAQMDKVLLFLHHTRAATSIYKESWYTLQRQKRRMYLQSTQPGGSVGGPSIMQRLPQPSKRLTRGWPSDEDEEDEDEDEDEEEEEEDEEDDDDDEDEDDDDDASQIIVKKETAIKPPFVPFSRPGGRGAVLHPHTPAIAPAPLSATSTPTPTPTPTSTPMPAAPPLPMSAASSRASTPSTVSTQADGSPFKAASRRRDAERRPGETEAQYFVRRARESHRRIPDVAYIAPATEPNKSGDASTAMWQTVVEKHNHIKAKVKAQRAASLINAKAAKKDEQKDNKAEKVEKEEKAAKKAAAKDVKDHDVHSEFPDSTALSRWALRDWTDVIAAAALSGGFDDAVIARTAQRCADLFGQSMALNTMEMPARGDASFRTTVYAPHAPATAASAPTELPAKPKKATAEVQVQRAWRQRRQRLTRREAIMAADALTEESEEEGDRQMEKAVDAEEEEEEEDGDDADAEERGPEAVKREAAHKTPSPQPESVPVPSLQVAVGRDMLKKGVTTIFYCPQPGCNRAVEGFTRRPNAVRHLKLVHGLVASTADIRQSKGAGEWPM